jgi:uncharacterized protein DUF6214
MSEIGEVTTVRYGDSGWVPAGDRYVLPRSFTAMISESADYPDLALDLAVDVDNFARTSCRELRVRALADAAVTPETLRRLRLPELLRIAARAAMEKVERDDSGALRQAPMTAADAREFYELFRGARKPRQGTPMTDDELRRIAELYRAAQARGFPPVKAITEAPPKPSRATASRWVAEARRRGFLEQRREHQ